MQAGQEALGLLLDAGRSRHGQEHGSQFLSSRLIFLLFSRTDIKKTFFSSLTIKVMHDSNFSASLPPCNTVLIFPQCLI